MAMHNPEKGVREREEALQQFDLAYTKYREILLNFQEGKSFSSTSLLLILCLTLSHLSFLQASSFTPIWLLCCISSNTTQALGYNNGDLRQQP